jgi:hypothetical protein
MVAQYNRPKPVDWTLTYANTDKIPFGTFILYDRLNDIFPKSAIRYYRERLYNVLNDDSIKNSAVLIICNTINLNEYDYAALKKHINKGNNVFIAAVNYEGQLYKELKIETRSEQEKNSQTYLNFTSKSLTDSTYVVDHESSNQYFSRFDTLKATVLGKNGYNHTSFMRFKMGKGSLYLNANPQMFTNYSLLQDKGADYAAKALSYISTESGLVWDEYYSRGKDGEESSMRVFLSHPPLRWAFYIVFFSLLIFVIYQSKRRQRIIPIIEPVTNTSVEFATIVGQVYYEQRDNSNIAQKKATYFLEYIRTRYNLRTNVLDADFIQTLANKSGVSISLIQALFYQLALIQSGQKVDSDLLIDFNQNIEQFYTLTS